MKKIFFAALGCMVLLACNNDKAEEKKVMDDILATHEKVMAIEDKAVENKIHLDSLVKINQMLPANLSKPQTNFKQLSDSLNTASEGMENWMHGFDPEYKAKSHVELMKYLETQRLKINTVKGRLDSAISQSSKVLANYKK